MAIAVEVTFLDVGSIKPLWLRERADIDIIVPPDARVLRPTTVLHPQENLDGTTYLEFVSAAQAEVEAGANCLVIDLTGVETVSNAGMLGIYLIGALLKGDQFSDLEGYAIMRRMRDDIENNNAFANMAVAAPSEKIAQALANCGLDRLVAVLPNVDEAISALP